MKNKMPQIKKDFNFIKKLTITQKIIKKKQNFAIQKEKLQEKIFVGRANNLNFSTAISLNKYVHDNKRLTKFCFRPLNKQVSVRMAKKQNWPFQWLKTHVFSHGINVRFREVQYFTFLNKLSLFFLGKYSLKAFCTKVGWPMRHLHKKKHGFYLGYLSTVLKQVVFSKYSSISGMRIEFSGRIKAQRRCFIYKMSRGLLKLKTKTDNISRARTVIHSKYGVFCVKMWVRNRALKKHWIKPDFIGIKKDKSNFLFYTKNSPLALRKDLKLYKNFLKTDMIQVRENVRFLAKYPVKYVRDDEKKVYRLCRTKRRIRAKILRRYHSKKFPVLQNH